MTLDERIESKTDRYIAPGHAIWTGAIGGGGTPVIGAGVDNGGGQVRVNRYLYERDRGPIPEGMGVTSSCKEGRYCLDHLVLTALGRTPKSERHRRGRIYAPNGYRITIEAPNGRRATVEKKSLTKALRAAAKAITPKSFSA